MVILTILCKFISKHYNFWHYNLTFQNIINIISRILYINTYSSQIEKRIIFVNIILQFIKICIQRYVRLFFGKHSIKSLLTYLTIFIEKCFRHRVLINLFFICVSNLTTKIIYLKLNLCRHIWNNILLKYLRPNLFIVSK